MVVFLQRCKELPTEGRSEAELQEQVEKLRRKWKLTIMLILWHC
jgi:hypothetical protein